MKSQSLWSSTPAWRLPICKAPSPTSAWRLSIYKGALTSPCARQFIIPTRGSVCPPTSKVAISSLSGVSKETWLPLISPLEMHNAGGVFLRHSSPSSPTCSFIPTGSPSQLFSELDTYVFENDAIAVRADPTDMQIDARCASTSSARVNTTTSCTAVVPGAPSCAFSRFFNVGIPRMRGHKTPRSIDGNF